MKKPSRYRVGSVFIYNEGHPMFEGTLTKVGPDKWMKVTHKGRVRQYYTNETVEMLFSAQLLTLVHDSGTAEG